MQPLIDFYTSVIQFAGLRADDKGFIHGESPEANIVQIDGHMLALPTRHQLSKLSPEVEVFHPLSEDTLVKMSKPLSAYIYRLNGKLNTRFAELILELKNIACSPAKTIELTAHPQRLEIIRGVEGTENSNEKEKDFLNFIGGRLSEDPSRAFFQISLGRGGNYKGERQSRVGYVAFPLYTALRADLEKPRKEATYKSLSKEHCKMIVQLYEAIFPDLDKPEEYNYGYSSGPYPFFSALMNTALKLALSMNRINEAFEDMFSLEDFEPLNLEWAKAFEDKELLGRLSKMVGNLDMNPEIHNPQQAVQNLPQPTVTSTQTVASVAIAPQATPMQQGAPVQKKGETGSFDEWMQKKGVPSPMGMQGTIIEATRKHNEGYRNWYLSFLKANNGLSPANMPHPDQIPAGRLAPMYPGATPLPAMPGVAPYTATPVTPWGQPQQPMQPQVNTWGQPMQPQQPMNAWGQPMPPQQPVNTWGQPMQPQQPVNTWGQPVQSQMNAWGQPVQATSAWGQPMQPQVNTWGQPMQPQVNAWGQPMNTSNGTIIPGAV